MTGKNPSPYPVRFSAAEENLSTENTLIKASIPVKSPNRFAYAPSPISQPNSCDRIKIFLRVRPEIKTEKSINFTIEDQTIRIHPPSGATTSAFCVDKSFSFRGIFGPNSTQEEVFSTAAAPLLTEFLDGSDVLLFCYGSTNAGKTFTITGTKDGPGILKRSLESIITQISKRECSSPKKKPKLYASYIEIYNEKIFDLLKTGKHEEIRKLGFNREGETEVKGATENQLSSVADIDPVLEQGESERHRGCTELNRDSSRSHTIFRLRRQVGRRNCFLSIVDLAGCERLSMIHSGAGSFKEACNINKSMLVLGKCIRQLKEQGSSSKKIPISYRESKLTHLFKNFFEPIHRQSKAAIIVNVSPATTQLDDTVFALQFAAEASQVAIRQIAQPASDHWSDEDDETISEMQERVRSIVEKEMEEWITEKRKKILEQIRTMELFHQQYTCSVEKLTEEFELIIMRNKQLEITRDRLRAETAALEIETTEGSGEMEKPGTISSLKDVKEYVADSYDSPSFFPEKPFFDECSIRLPTIAEELLVSDEFSDEDNPSKPMSTDPRMIHIPCLKQ
jgi:hypothetical protein